MIGAWMVYALVVSTLFGLGAVLLERAFRLARLPGRWICAGAMAASLVLPAIARTTPAEPAPAAPRIVAVVDALVPTALPRSDGLAMLHVPLLLLWLTGSLIVASLILLTHRRVTREVRRYVPGSLDGVPVRRTAGFGPAVVGLVRSVIVIPAWIDLLDDGARRLILRHEQEHQRVGDSRLLFVATLAVTLQPWNLALWWQLCRLREAMELDCDHRVLSSGVDLRAYGQLLLAMSRRRPPSPLAAVALSNPKATLDRRITAMTIHHTPAAYARALCAASLGALLVSLGCKTPSPVAPTDTGGTRLAVASESVPTNELGSRLAGSGIQVPINLNEIGIEPEDVANALGIPPSEDQLRAYAAEAACVGFVLSLTRTGEGGLRLALTGYADPPPSCPNG